MNVSAPNRSISGIGSVSFGWLHEQGGFQFDEPFFLNPHVRLARERQIQAFVAARFPGDPIYNMEAHLGQVEYRQRPVALVGALQPNLILGAALGAQFVFYGDKDPDITPTPLADLRQIDSLGHVDWAQRWPVNMLLDQVHRTRVELGEHCLVVPPFFWETSGRENLGKVESDIKDAESDLEENSRKLDGLSRVLSSKAKHRVQKVTHKVEVLEGLTMLFNEGIEVLRDRLREQVADLATKAFHQLTTEKTYKGLSINENYGLTIVDRKKKEVAERSAGAEQIVALSLIDGLNRTARKTGPIVMDTPLGRLDPRHRRNVLEFIPDMGEQVVLLVHEGEIDRERDLEPLVDRIAAVYEIQRVSSSESRLVLV